MTATIIKIGNSKGVIIPASLLKKLSLGTGDEILLNIDGDKLVIRKNLEYTGPFTGPFAALKDCQVDWGMSGVEYEDMLRSGRFGREIEEW